MKAYLIIEDKPEGGLRITPMRQLTVEEVKAGIAPGDTLAGKYLNELERLIDHIAKVANQQPASHETNQCLH